MALVGDRTVAAVDDIEEILPRLRHVGVPPHRSRDASKATYSVRQAESSETKFSKKADPTHAAAGA